MTAWGRVYYQNFIALAPLTVIGLANGDVQNMLDGSLVDPASGELFTFSTASYTALAASCVGGVGMCYSGFLLRKEVRQEARANRKPTRARRRAPPPARRGLAGSATPSLPGEVQWKMQWCES
jgi:hypothetical protein